MSDSLIIHEYKISLKGIAPKIIYHISDVHLCEWDENSTPEEKASAVDRTAEWEVTRRWFAETYNEPCEKRQEIPAAKQYANLLSATADGDAVVFSGDIMDYVSAASLKVMEEGLRGLNCPFVAVCGNHESAESLPDGMLLSEMKKPLQVVDLGDILLVGIDNSTRTFTDEQLKGIESLFSANKPIIITMHCPAVTDENRATLQKCGEYFLLEEPANSKFIELIRSEKSTVCAVLTGHLHFKLNTRISDKVMQYGASQGIAGNINKFIIGEI